MVVCGSAVRALVCVCHSVNLGYPMGPIELMDYVGLDTAKFIMDGVCVCVCGVCVCGVCACVCVCRCVCRCQCVNVLCSNVLASVYIYCVW